MQAEPAFSAAVALGAGDPMRGHLGPVPPDWASLSARRAKPNRGFRPETGRNEVIGRQKPEFFRTRTPITKLKMTDLSGENTFCNARKRGNGDLEKVEPGPYAGDGYCKQQTDGGRCRMHGRDAGPRPKHGLYSDLREDLQEYVDDALALDAPGDLQGELAVLRALVKRWLDNAGDLDRDAIEAAHKLLKEVRRTSDTIHQQMMRERLSKEEERQLVDTFAEIITEYVQPSDRDDALDALQRALDGRSRVRQIEGK